MPAHSIDGDWLCDIINDIIASNSWFPTPITWSVIEHEKCNNNIFMCAAYI
jgi:hypothetical protein